MLRTTGDNHEPKRFPTFAPKLLAGIGGLPDTLESRCTPIVMHRKLASEDCERLRLRRVKPEAKALTDQFLELDHPLLIEALAEADPQLPDELGDRAQDCAEPLLAIADYAGGVWPRKLRAALVELHGGGSIQDESANTRLLFDIKHVLEDQDRLSTKDLLAGLWGLEEAPWHDWFGKPIGAHKLASMLHGYGIHSRAVRIGDKTPKGYLRKDFEPVWERYSPAPVSPEAPDSASQNATPQQSHEQAENGTFQNATDESVLRSENPEKPHEQANVAVLRFEEHYQGGEDKKQAPEPPPAAAGRRVVDEAVTAGGLGRLLPVDEADARIGAIDGNARERNGNRDEHRDANEMLREDEHGDVVAIDHMLEGRAYPMVRG